MPAASQPGTSSTVARTKWCITAASGSLRRSRARSAIRCARVCDVMASLTQQREPDPACRHGVPGCIATRCPLRARPVAPPSTAASVGLLPGHGDPKPFVGGDVVVVVVHAEVDLHPVDLFGEPAGRCGVVGGDGAARLV